MPAIPATESATTVIASPAKSGAGGSAGASEAPSSPFAAVLARQVAHGDARPVSDPPTDSTSSTADPEGDTTAELLPLFCSPDKLSSLYAAFSDTGNPNGEQSTDTGQGSESLLSVLTGIPIAVVNTTGNLETASKSGNTSSLTAEANAELDNLGLSASTSRHALAETTANIASGQASTAKSPAIVAASPDFSAVVTDKLVGNVGLESSMAAREDGVMSAAAAALMHANPAAQASSPADLHIAAQIGTNRWESAIGNSLVFMTGNGRQHAELVLNPPQLGRIDVSVSVSGDQASAFFVSANPAVREALENAMPRLKEIFADAGITLGQAQVGSESPRQPADNRENNDNSTRGGVSDFGGSLGTQPVDTQVSTLRVAASRGLVDTFA
jgi:flagellar hook-length control protein FliK